MFRLELVVVLLALVHYSQSDTLSRQRRQIKIDLANVLEGLGNIAQQASQQNGNNNNNNDPLLGLIGGILGGQNGGNPFVPTVTVDGSNGPQTPRPPTPVQTTTTTRRPQRPQTPRPPPIVNPGNGGNSGRCFERRTEFIGTELSGVSNGIRNKQRNKEDCQKNCQETSGCNYWTYVSRRERNGLARSCYLFSQKSTQVSTRKRTSGPKFCSSQPPNTPRPPITPRPPVTPRPPITSSCLTVDGGKVNAGCVFPFSFRGRTYNGCTTSGDPELRLWCSTRTDSNGVHISGQGEWGHCNSACRTDQDGRPPSTTTTTTTTTTRRTTQSAPLRGCGENNRRFQTKIVGGRPADPNEWPWLAALVRPSSTGSGQFCGGTLVSSQHVVTAAHCVKPFKMEQIGIKLGEYDFDQDGETLDSEYRLIEMIPHENYDTKTFENDIAVLKLDRPVIFNNSTYPICLPPSGKTFTNTRAFVVGWGTIYFGGPTSNILQEVNLRVWNNKECATNYGRLNRKITDTMLCAGEQQRDACQGDSGGPLNCLDRNTGKWELCGVVSWGARCAEPDFPGVYTRTTEYLDWIEANMS